MYDARADVRDLHARAPQLVRTALIGLVITCVALIALLVDHRELVGAPIWLKPAKFGLSTAAYLLALAYLIRDLPDSRLLRRIGGTIGWVIVFEDLLIAIQAARGTSSHFNLLTTFDQTVFSLMGVGIGLVWVLSIVLLVLHVRTPARDRTMAMAFRFGLALNVIGAAVGWIMVQPKPGQVEAMMQARRPLRVGAHTIGAPDGGPGLPILNWSTTAGDLRVPHFIGMHALQLLPLLVLLLRRVRGQRGDALEHSLLTLAAGACAALFFTALLQALNGHPLIPAA